MVSFLKRFGTLILKGGAVILRFAPIAQQAANAIAPGSGDHLSQLFQTILDVEVMGQSLGLPGSQKVRAAAPNVEQLILDFLQLRGLKVDDTKRAQLTVSCTALGGVLADILNTVHPDSVTATPVIH